VRQTRKHRIGRTVIREFDDRGRPRVFVDDGLRVKEYGGNFREAIVAVKQAPLVEMRDECLRMAQECRDMISEDEPEDAPQPVAHCPRCGTPWYTTGPGFCGVCGR